MQLTIQGTISSISIDAMRKLVLLSFKSELRRSPSDFALRAPSGIYLLPAGSCAYTRVTRLAALQDP